MQIGINSIAPKKVGSRLADFVGKNKLTVGYISSCPDESRQFYQQAKRYYSQFQAVLLPYIDLEDGFSTTTIESIFQADAIHLSGGNTYRFLYWILRRGLSKRLIQYAHTGGVLIGVSAGSIIMTPNINISKLCDDRNDIGLKNCTGLNLVDFHYLPHAVRGQAPTKKVVSQSKQNGSSIIVVSDEDWIVVDQAKYEIYGDPQLVVGGQISDVKHLLL